MWTSQEHISTRTNVRVMETREFVQENYKSLGVERDDHGNLNCTEFGQVQASDIWNDQSWPIFVQYSLLGACSSGSLSWNMSSVPFWQLGVHSCILSEYKCQIFELRITNWRGSCGCTDRYMPGQMLWSNQGRKTEDQPTSFSIQPHFPIEPSPTNWTGGRCCCHMIAVREPVSWRTLHTNKGTRRAGWCSCVFGNIYFYYIPNEMYNVYFYRK